MRATLRRVILISVAMASLAGAARADKIQWRGISLPQPEVTGAEDFAISYRLRSGTQQSRPLSDIDLVEINGADALNQAERTLAQDPAKALELYQKAASDLEGWKQRLARYRLIQAAKKAKRIDLAVEAWLAVVGDQPSKNALAMIPDAYGPAKSQVNADAIAALEKRLADKPSDALAAAIRQMLVGLYRGQGDTQRAAEIAQQVVAGGTGGPGPTGDGQLQAVQALLDQKQYDQAVGTLRAGMKDYTEQLPSAMLLMARARMGQWEQGGRKDRQALLDAGLWAMRVAVFYPNTPLAPAALMVAGEANVGLGNAPAAAAAYRKVVNQYPQSPQASLAREALSNLTKNP